MTRKWSATIIVGGSIVIYSLWRFLKVPAMHVGICNTVVSSEQYQKTVEFLDSIIQLGLTLATGLIGLVAALMIGLQGSLRMTPWNVTFLAGSVVCLAQAILYGVWWKVGIANLWFNECWEKIDADFLQYRYSTSYEFFMLGVVLIGILVVLIALQRVGELSAASGGPAPETLPKDQEIQR
jgi:small-conductance mechanosensitive channel